MMCRFIKLTPSTELTTCQELAKYTGLLEREPEDVLNSSGKQNGQKLSIRLLIILFQALSIWTFLYICKNFAMKRINEKKKLIFTDRCSSFKTMNCLKKNYTYPVCLLQFCRKDLPLGSRLRFPQRPWNLTSPCTLSLYTVSSTVDLLSTFMLRPLAESTNIHPLMLRTL